MLCECKEPSLSELLREPIVRAVMACDLVEESELRRLIARAREEYARAPARQQRH